MRTNPDFLLNFIFTMAFTVLIFAVLKVNKDGKMMRAEIGELRLFLNEKNLENKVADRKLFRLEF